jgi:histidine triad (HIT) family protein
MLQANGAAAFQSVPHFHLHLIPRWNKDGKGFDWTPTPGDREHVAKTGEALRAAAAAESPAPIAAPDGEASARRSG